MNNKITVIGSNSFSGASFVKHCLEQNYVVQGISRSKEFPSVFLPYKWKVSNANFHFVEGDLNLNLSQISKSIQSFEPSIIVNFAAQGMVAESWQNPLHWFETNVLGHIGLHQIIKDFTFIKKYVHISTPEVYGTCSGVISEDAPYNPSTPYAVSKAACDMSLKTFFNNYKFPVVWTRAANVYGPGQALYRIIPKTILSILLGKKLPLHGGGHSSRSFIHMQDVSNATLKIAIEADPGNIFHISTYNFITIRSLVEKICNKLDVSFQDVAEITEDRPGKDSAYTLGSDKLRKQLNWKEEIDLDQGLDETISWVKENLAELRTLPDYYIHKK